MLAYEPKPPSTAALIFGIIFLFIIPLLGLILIIYYIVEKSNYNQQVTQMYNQQLNSSNSGKIERL